MKEERKILELWVDGAINIHNPKLPGGWSTVFVYDNMLMHTEWAGVAPTTSQRMELTAPIVGLTSILNKKHKALTDLCFNEIKVVSDSGYVVNCLTQMWYIQWRFNDWISAITNEPIKNRDLWEELLDVVDKLYNAGYKVTWRKVKGHSGIMYNELADKLAVKAKLSVS